MTDKVVNLEDAWTDGSIVGMKIYILGHKVRVTNTLTTVFGGIMVDPPVTKRRFWNISDAAFDWNTGKESV